MIKSDFKQKFNYEIRKLSLKHNLSIDEVVDIYFNQFNFISKHIRKNENNSFKLKGFGTFVYNETLANKLTELKTKKNEREILSKSSTENGNRAEPN